MKSDRNILRKRLSMFFGIVGFTALLITLASCGKEDTGGITQLNVRLTDAPGDFQEVNIEIERVEVKRGTDNGESGWIALDTESGVYNLLDFTNGLDMLLANGEVPSGRLSQIRLILGSNNSVRVDDVNWGLATPSAQQSGLKLNIQANLKDGVDYTLLLDFDAAQSIIQNNSGYSLKPVIRLITEATSGTISGTVTPHEASPAIFVINGLDTLASSFTDELGRFILQGVPAGSYSVSFNAATGYQSSSLDGIDVTVGNVTDLGVVTIAMNP